MVVVVLQPLSCIPVGQPHGLYPTRLLCPRDASGKNTGVGCHFSTPWHLPNPGIEIASLVSPVSQVDSLLSEPSGKPPPKKNYGNSETKETSSWNLFILETIYRLGKDPKIIYLHAQLNDGVIHREREHWRKKSRNNSFLDNDFDISRDTKLELYKE